MKRYQRAMRKRRRMLYAGIVPADYQQIGWPLTAGRPDYLWPFFGSKPGAWNR